MQSLLIFFSYFIEQSKITITPRRLSNLPFGETAHFNCSGIGSYIRISWRFNNSLTCNKESCNHVFLSYREESQVVDEINNNLAIDSTMSINTSQLKQQEFINIECRVEQMMPLELNLPGETRTFFTNVRVDFSMSTTTIRPCKDVAS